MNALLRPLPERELLIEDMELKSGTLAPAYASVRARIRFDADGWPYVFEVIDMQSNRSLALPEAWNELIEQEAIERYAPRVLEDA